MISLKKTSKKRVVESSIRDISARDPRPGRIAAPRQPPPSGAGGPGLSRAAKTGMTPVGPPFREFREFRVFRGSNPNAPLPPPPAPVTLEPA
jgi:hypothetical protein